MVNKEKNSLDELKKEYSNLQKKYSLPSFEEMNEDFSIEKATEFEGSLLLREIRRYIVDKISNYMRVVENLINPVNVPMFVFSMVKSFDEKDRDALSEMYKKFSEFEIDLIEVDLVYSEEREARFVNDSFKFWQIVKKDLVKIVGKAKNTEETKPKNNEKNYFG